MELGTTGIDLSWQLGDMNSFYPIIVATFGFIIYWFIAKSGKIKARFYNSNTADEASIKHILFTKYMGLLWMGIIPLILLLIILPQYRLADYGLTLLPETTLTSMAWIVGLALIIVPVAIFSAKNPKNFVNYPQIRAKEWTTSLKGRNALGWAAYLFGYEILFRGILLFPLVAQFGVWPAIAINVALYSSTHIPKGLDETIGAIPLGIVLSLLTLLTGGAYQ
ncbi:MAG: membrane protease YdiL (CAAX protease family) [Halieaceae bacterium]|jgi:membrane protease YdiL (CAAX protease family)